MPVQRSSKRRLFDTPQYSTLTTESANAAVFSREKHAVTRKVGGKRAKGGAAADRDTTIHSEVISHGRIAAGERARTRPHGETPRFIP